MHNVLKGCCTALLALSAQTSAMPPPTIDIAFGSCLRVGPQPIWQSLQDASPDALILLGDNVYADVPPYTSMPGAEGIFAAYREQRDHPDHRQFERWRERFDVPLYATWDDHDYGLNDAGADFPYRLESKAAFLEHFGLERTVSGDASQPGIYRSYQQSVLGLNLQVILLDTRSFRSPLRRQPATAQCNFFHAVPETDPAATVLGEAQWQWLEQTLRQPADLRLLVSSIQVLPTQHCFEKWANFPHERQRLLDLIRTTRANGVVLISGDRHLAEISRFDDMSYPLYEVTSSGMNSAMGADAPAADEANSLRVGPVNHRVNNYGLIRIDTDPGPSRVRLQIRDLDNHELQSVEIPLSELQP